MTAPLFTLPTTEQPAPLPHVVALHHERPDLHPRLERPRWAWVPTVIRDRYTITVADLEDAYAYDDARAALGDDYWAVSGDLAALHPHTGNSVGVHCRACDPTEETTA